MLYANGYPVGGGGGGSEIIDGIDGVFIDTSNVIKSTTSFTSSMSYTATDDCCVAFYIVGKQSTDGLIKIDNKKVGGFFASSIEGFSCAYYLKKGQTITVTNAHASYSSDYTVYGIQTGTTHSKFQPVIYSTEEREIGVWKDGKPLYQKTLVVDNVGEVTSSTQNTCIAVNDIPFDYVQVVASSVYDNSSDQRRYPLPNTPRGNANGIYYHSYLTKESSPVIFYVSLYTNSGTYSNLTDLEFTIQYTKSTDVAGSGSWTPQGVPAVHYSTDEQVIGTWMGETLYQRSYDFSANPIDLSANSWTNTTASNSGIDKIINNEAMTSDGININWLGANAGTGSYIQLLNIRNSTIGIAYLTIQYTKSS